MVPVRDMNEQMIGIVRIFMTMDGKNIEETYLGKDGKTEKAPKRANLGATGGGSVVVQEGASSRTLWVAEGIETALAVAKAVPNQRVVASISAGQLKNIPVAPLIEKVVICADNDGIHKSATKAVIEAIDHHLSKGRRVFLTLPEMPKGIEKFDFNDLIKVGGIPSVQRTLNTMMEIKTTADLKIECRSLVESLDKMRGIEMNKTIPSLQSKEMAM